MATKKKYALAVKTGSYTDSSGKEKGRYQNVGCVLEKDDGGKFILLERTFNPAGVANPDGKSTVIISMFEPKNGDGEKPAAEPAKTLEEVDSIPF